MCVCRLHLPLSCSRLSLSQKQRVRSALDMTLSSSLKFSPSSLKWTFSDIFPLQCDFALQHLFITIIFFAIRVFSHLDFCNENQFDESTSWFQFLSVCLLVSLCVSESHLFKSILGATPFGNKPAVNKGASSSGQESSVGTWEEPKLEQHPWRGHQRGSLLNFR